MPPKQLPANHIFGTNAKQGKQVGKQPSNAGVIYFMTSASNAITADSSESVAVKIGLASGGEAEAYKVLCNHQTSNDGDTSFIALLPVRNVGRAEARIHDYLRAKGYSTLHGWDGNLPAKYRKYYQQQEGGSEWFVLPLSMLEATVTKYREDLPTPAPWVDGWIGQSEKNPPIRFHYDAEAVPSVDLQGRLGRPPEEKALRFAWQYRNLTGFAPMGCCSLL